MTSLPQTMRPLLSLVAVAIMACGHESSATQTDVPDADPAGWRRVTFAQAVSLSIPPDSVYREYSNIEGQSAHLETPRFLAAFHYTKNLNSPRGGAQAGSPGETRQEERIVIGGLPAQLVRVRRPSNPAAAKRSPRDLSSFSIGVHLLIERAGPAGRDILGDVGCDEQSGCDEAERVIRSMKLIPYSAPRDSNLPPVRPPG